MMGGNLGQMSNMGMNGMGMNHQGQDRPGMGGPQGMMRGGGNGGGAETLIEQCTIGRSGSARRYVS